MDITARPPVAQRIPSDFPLSEGMLTCLSCHDLAQDCRAERQGMMSDRALLRGARASDPVEFCFRCHPPESYRPFNPHAQLQGDQPKPDTCLWCHVSIPEAGSRPEENSSCSLRAKSDGVCRNCHTVAREHPVIGHMRAIPSPEMTAYMSAVEMQSRMRLPFEQLLEYARAARRVPRSIPLDEDGRITCYSCHNPHEKGLLPSANPRSIGAEPGQAVNHRLRSRNGKSCVACHQK